jgi:hypothetical protein
MTSRVGGVLALIAVAVLTWATLVPWWDGHPTVDGNEVRLLDADIGLFGGERCNTGGDGACTKLPLVGGFKTLEAIEVGAIAAAAVLAAVVGALALSRKPQRKPIARVSIAAGAASAIVALVLIVTGPDIHYQQTVTVPTGLGAIVGLIGSLLAVVAGLVARRDDAPPAPRVVLPVAVAVNAPVAPMEAARPAVAGHGFDVQALTADDALRPTRLDAEPMSGRSLQPSTTGNLPGPAGPLVPQGHPSAPLFSAAPQLRPLYEMPGTGAFTPPAPPPLPSRAPTPIAREVVDEDGAAAAARRPPLPRKTAPPPLRPSVAGRGRPETRPPVTGSQPPPMLPSSAPRPPSPGTQSALPTAAMPARPAPRVPPSPIAPVRVSANVPTPPPLEMPTPTPVSVDVPALSGSDLIVEDAEPSQDSFDRQATHQRTGEEVVEDTSPGLGIALEETPAAELLGPDDIETRGMRKLTNREHEAPRRESAAVTTPVPQILMRPSDGVMSSSPRPPPGAPAQPDTDESEAIDEDPPESTGEPTDDHMPVLGAVSSPPRIATPPPGALKPPDVAHAATVHAPAPSTAALKAAQLGAKPAQVAPRLAPVAVAETAPAPTVQPPPPRALKTPQPNSGPQPACPQCEAPMAWVEEHLRFYCRSCKMYF